MARLLRGQINADRILIDCAVKIDSLRDVSAKLIPGLAIVQVGADATSAWYVQHLRLACAKVGMNVVVKLMGEHATTEDVVACIAELNAAPKWHGVYVHRPLPPEFDEVAVSCAVSVVKDVDGMHPHNLGLLGEGKDYQPVAAAAKACMDMIRSAKVDPRGKRATVVGIGGWLETPVAWLLSQAGATVTACDGKDEKHTVAACKKADIVICAAGKAHHFTAAATKPGSLVIDTTAKIVDGKEVGEIELASVTKLAKTIVPVPGGLEPLTAAYLVDTTMKLSIRQGKRRGLDKFTGLPIGAVDPDEAPVA